MIGMPNGTLEPCHKTKGSIGKLWFVCSTRIQNQNVNWVQTPAVLGRKGKCFICKDFLRFISVPNLNYTIIQIGCKILNIEITYKKFLLQNIEFRFSIFCQIDPRF